jgi:NAD(P)-dependent dehydrogenase (short-subunit alcohol dehydrogenase family)
VGVAPYPLGGGETPIDGKRFALADDGGGIARAVAETLAGLGAEADIIQRGAADLSMYDGLLLVNAAASPERYTAPDLFRLLKAADMGRLAWVCVLDDTLSALRAAPGAPAPESFGLIEGFPGFIKTLRLEHPDINFRTVSFCAPLDAEAAPGIAAAELRARDGFPEILYDGSERLRFRPAPEAAPGADGGQAATGGAALRGARGVLGGACEGLKPGSVSNVLVIGGGHGITPVLAARLAEDYPCRYILIGRSRRDAALAEKYSGLGGPDAIRRHLIAGEGMKSPRQIEKNIQAIVKARGIEDAIGAIEAAGGVAAYHSVDAADGEAFCRFLAEARQLYGRIDGVIHADGIIEDKLFSAKSAESFDRTYRTKAEPLRTVARELMPGLKLLALFSSMASAAGNRGQCDYAAGNSVLDIAAGAFLGADPSMTVKVFDWGPWSGAGMVSGSLENEFRRRGVATIGLEEGSEFFAEEIKRGGAVRVLAVAGDMAAAAAYLGAAFGSEGMQEAQGDMQGAEAGR